MASGTINKTFRTGYTLRLNWEETATSVSANTSTVKVTAQLVSGGSSYTIVSSASKAISITVDGTTKSSTCSVALSGNQTKTLTTQTFTVKHSADGTKTAAISCDLKIAVTLGGTYYGTVSASGSAKLTTLAQTPSSPSSFTASAGYGNYVGSGDTVTLKWSGASGTITGYEIQSAHGSSGWVAYKTITSTATSGSWQDTTTGTNTALNAAGNQIKYRIRAMNGNLAGAWKTANALTITGGMDIKVSGSWKTGSVFIKVNGAWKRAKRVWIKVNGTWQYSK